MPGDPKKANYMITTKHPSIIVRFGRILAATLAVLVLSATASRAANITWNGVYQYANWSDANNWDPSQVPGAGDSVTIGSSQRVTVDVDVVVNFLELQGEMEIVSGASLTANDYAISGILDVDPNAVVTLAGSPSSSMSGLLVIYSSATLSVGQYFNNSGTLHQVGTFNSTGTTVVNNNGIWNVYNQPLGSIGGGTFHNKAGGRLVTQGTPSIINMIFYDEGGQIQIQSGSIQFNAQNNVLPFIERQPFSTAVPQGQTAFFDVIGYSQNGSPTTFQWRKNGQNIPGANANSLQIPNVSSADVGAYSVVLANAYGSTTSAVANLTLNAPLVTITAQPASQSVFIGQNATFTVTAANATTYQWRKNGQNISGATSSTLQLLNVTAADAASYSVVAANAGNSIISASATLTVFPAPVITAQPASQSVYTGQNALFSVTAIGNGVTFQWKKDGQAIAGATSSSLALPSVSTASAGDYSAVVSNPSGSVTSAAGHLTVFPAPSILTQPGSLSVFENQSASFSVVATGSGITYQWKKDGQAIAGATSTTYSIAQVFSFSEGDYTVEITNPAGAITSSPAHLTILAPSYLQNIAETLAASIGSRALQSSVTAVQTSFNTLVDTNLASRASQQSVDSVATSLSAKLDTNVASRASQTSADPANSGIALANAKLDANILSRASQDSLNQIGANVTAVSGKVDDAKSSLLSAVNSSASALTTTIGNATAAEQASLAAILAKLNSSPDGSLLSRASQASLDDLTTNTLVTLANSVLSRASQASVDGVSASLVIAGGKLDTLVSSTATQAGLATVSAVLNGKLDALNAAAVLLTAQSSLESAQSALAQTKLDSLQTSASTISGKIDASQAVNQSSLNAATAKLDATVSSRASQSSLDDLATNSLVTLANNVLTRATQASVDNANAALATATGKLNSLANTAATLATQSAVDGFQTTVNGKLDALGTTAVLLTTQAGLETAQSALAQTKLDTLQSSANTINGKIDSLQTANQSGLNAATARLDVNVSSRASQASLDDLTTNTMATLASTALSRASQSSVDNANAALASANAAITTRATQASVDAANASLAAASAKLNVGLDINVGSRASQTSVDLANAGLATANSKLDASISTRATQASMDAANSSLGTVSTKLSSDLDTNVLSRASQSSMNTANTALTSANSSLAVLDGKLNARLDTAVSSRASQTSMDTANAKLVFGLDTNVLSRASQDTMNTANTALTAANGSLAVLDGKLNARLDSTVSSRSSQTSMDAANAKLTFGLDTNVVSRASQVSLDAGIDLLSRLDIERQLAEVGAPRLALLFLPLANGGQLEFVRDIVTDSIQLCLNAGVAVGKANTFLTTANTAYANRQYKSAYDNYANAYQAVVK